MKQTKTPKWMVKIMEYPIKIDDLGGFSPYFWKHSYFDYKLMTFLKYYKM